MPELLIDHGHRTPRPVAESIAYFKLLCRRSTPDGGTRAGYLIDKFPDPGPSTAEMWAILSLDGTEMSGLELECDARSVTERLEPRIRKEIEHTGSSRTLQWLAEHGAYQADDITFRQLIEARAAAAFRERAAVEGMPAAPRALRSKQGMIAVIAQGETDPVFVAGTTLLELAGGPSVDAPDRIECGTFAGLTDTARSLRQQGLEVVSLDDDRLTVSDGAVVARIDKYQRRDSRVLHRDGALLRWHRTFEPVRRVVGEIACFVPSDLSQYLTERFGSWQKPTVMRDDCIDAPNTTVDDSIEGLLYAYRRTGEAFADPTPFVARHMSAALRDQFGVDVTDHLPQPVHPKVLFTPVLAQCPDGCRSVMIVGTFDVMDADTVRLLERARPEGCHLIAAVAAQPEHDRNDRLMTVKALRSVDHVLMWDTLSVIRGHLHELRVEQVLVTPGAGVDRDELEAASRGEGLQVDIAAAPAP